MPAHHLRSREEAKSYSWRFDTNVYRAECKPKEVSHVSRWQPKLQRKTRDGSVAPLRRRRGGLFGSMVAPILSTTALMARTTVTTPVSDRTTTTAVPITGAYTGMGITAMVFTITAASILPGAVSEGEAVWAGFMVDSTEAQALPMAGEATADRPIAVC